jgi:hypothetical protein
MGECFFAIIARMFCLKIGKVIPAARSDGLQKAFYGVADNLPAILPL